MDVDEIEDRMCEIESLHQNQIPANGIESGVKIFAAKIKSNG